MSATQQREQGESEPVVVTRDGPIMTATLNRPHRKNAIDTETWARLHEALRTATHDEDVRVVVLTGAGGEFCAGADLGSDRTQQHPLERMRGINEVAMTLHTMPKPVIARVSGVAVGAGWNLALGCDFVVATPEARFCQIFTRRGLSPDFGGSWLLPRLVGLQQAKRLALLGDFLDAAQAHQLGLVTWVKTAEEIEGFVTELAHRLAASPPVALAQTKALLNDGVDASFDAALANEARAQAVNFATEDAPEAFRAFAEKAEPTFTGRWAGP